MASIPPDLEPLVLQQAGKGLTTRQIASWLKDKHSVDTTYKTVAKLLARTRSERSEIAKVVLRDKLSGSLTTDIDRLEKHARQLDEVADGYVQAINEGIEFARKGGERPIYVEGGETYAKVVEQLRKITDTKLHYSGAGEPDEGNQRKPVIYIPAESDD